MQPQAATSCRHEGVVVRLQELMRLKKVVATAETTLKNYQSEVDKLNHIISEADAERFRQQREYDVVINE